MANTDGFIEEVNEELRRDRLFSLFRKWGWIPISLILLLVGGAAYREYSIAQQNAAAQSFGDTLIAALSDEDDAARIAALSGVQTESEEAQVLLALLLAAEQVAGDDAEGAAAGLLVLADSSDLTPRYRDLIILKAHLIDPGEGLENMALLDRIATPGRPFRPLAIEQQALLQVAAGETEAGIQLLRVLEQDSQATPGLQQRASQLIVALEAGSALQEAPAEEGAPAEDADPVTDGEEMPPEEEAPAEEAEAESGN